MLVVVPCVVPCTYTEANGRGLPAISVTAPCTWAVRFFMENKKIKNRNLYFMFC